LFVLMNNKITGEYTNNRAIQKFGRFCQKNGNDELQKLSK
jgi:hypothetical protein